ncbi:Senescence-specific cysteine protease SAG39 [Seminavis robusta]|uniref:Senescence-specific cysteine protease SAG39 n=1 Tax=Seminavis robusta TaxID=568900 RepID=A0A9N8DP12_9STRA|nr:Senescence-specific cysteine protease SAG39 [Seminavis robusta]|eukprot:Sro252_g099720.1 Senescence-specific cysteine protease SAG39 (541) ;mRNA; r:82320-84331
MKRSAARSHHRLLLALVLVCAEVPLFASAQENVSTSSLVDDFIEDTVVDLVSSILPEDLDFNDTSTDPTSNPSSEMYTAFECTDDRILTCIEGGNRSCFQGECRACLPDFVELPMEVLELEDDDNVTTIIKTLNMSTAGTSIGTICAPKEAFTEALFEKVFKPIWLDVLSGEERLNILLGVAEYIARNNLENKTYTLGMNEFSGDSVTEYRRLGGYLPPSDLELVLSFLIAAELDELTSTAEVPRRVDWVERGAVTSVKNQGRCGGCWSIAVAGTIEGAAAIWSNFTYLQSVSFQQFISCDDSSFGCDGGYPAYALQYANNNFFGGVAILNDYPFTDGEEGVTSAECKIEEKDVAIESQLSRAFTYYGNVGDNTFEKRMELMKFGVSQQPLAIAVNTKCELFKNYKSGVVTEDDECSCRPTDQSCLDHSVLLVGYDDDHDPPFWKIKNSWGPRWGEDGYIRIAQLNPHPNSNSWGLFGLLAEGIAPLQAFNQTAQVKDEPQFLTEPWEIAVFIIGIVGAVGILCVAVLMLRNCFCANKSS